MNVGVTVVLKSRILSFLFIPLFLIMFFQNCGPAFQINQSVNEQNIIPDQIEPNSGSTSPDSPAVDSNPFPIAISKNLKTVVAFGDSLTRGHNPKDPENSGIKGYVPSLQQKLPEGTDVLNCGISSQTTRDARSRFSQILRGDYSNCSLDTYDSYNTSAFYNFSSFQGKKPDLIIFMMGTNNVFTNNPSFLESYRDLNFYISEAKNIGAQFIILSLPPYSQKPGFPLPDLSVFGQNSNRIDHFNQLVQQVAVDHNDVFYVDIYSTLFPNWTSLNWDKIHLTENGNRMIADRLGDAILKNDFDQPFVAGGGCVASTGNKIANQMIICDCASGNSGSLLKCDNGVLIPIGQINQKCISYNDSFSFVNYHCPIKNSLNGLFVCSHPVTGKEHESIQCRDQ